MEVKALEKLEVQAEKLCKETPFPFRTVLLLFAKLQVPDCALTDDELLLRLRLNRRATLRGAFVKVQGFLRKFITRHRMQRENPERLAKLDDICNKLQVHQPPPVHEQRDANPDTFDPDAIDHAAAMPTSDGERRAPRPKFVLKLLRIVGD